MTYRIVVTGDPHVVDAAPDTPLLYVLRNDLGLNGPKFGCGLGQCGACASSVGGNAPPRAASLCDPAMVAKLGWPAAAEAIEDGISTPSNPAWDGLELSLRASVSQALLGQKTAKQALDDVAREWQRNLRRAGVIK